jgi:hypothetical protein
MKQIASILMLLLSFSGVLAQTEENISAALKSGNSKEIAKHFSANVNLKILNQDDIYSKNQAEMILKDFFTKNPVKNYTAKHNGTSKNGAQYTIGTLSTANGNFRTYYFIKKNPDGIQIQEFRIENEE